MGCDKAPVASDELIKTAVNNAKVIKFRFAILQLQGTLDVPIS